MTQIATADRSPADLLQQSLPTIQRQLTNWNKISPEEKLATLKNIRTTIGLPETVTKMDVTSGVAPFNEILINLYHSNSKSAGEFIVIDGKVNAGDGRADGPSESLEGIRYKVLHFAEQHGQDLAAFPKLPESKISDMKKELKQIFGLSDAASELKLVDDSKWNTVLNRAGRGHVLFGTKDKYLGAVTIGKHLNTPAGDDGWRISYDSVSNPGATSPVYDEKLNPNIFEKAVREGKSR